MSDRFAFPRLREVRVRITAPDVHARCPVQVHRGRSTDVGTRVQIMGEHFAHTTELVGADAVYLGHAWKAFLRGGQMMARRPQ